MESGSGLDGRLARGARRSPASDGGLDQAARGNEVENEAASGDWGLEGK
jgi:hypothetical protein